MTTLEKIIFCKEHGISLSYIAARAQISPATLTKWIKGQNNLSKKYQKEVNITLLKIAKEIWQKIGDTNDRDL